MAEIDFNKFDTGARLLLGIACRLAVSWRKVELQVVDLQQAVEVIESNEAVCVPHVDGRNIVFSGEVKQIIEKAWAIAGGEGDGIVGYEILRNVVVAQFVGKAWMFPPLGAVCAALHRIRVLLFGVRGINWTNVEKSML